MQRGRESAPCYQSVRSTAKPDVYTVNMTTKELHMNKIDSVIYRNLDYKTCRSRLALAMTTAIRSTDELNKFLGRPPLRSRPCEYFALIAQATHRLREYYAAEQQHALPYSRRGLKRVLDTTCWSERLYGNLGAKNFGATKSFYITESTLMCSLTIMWETHPTRTDENLETFDHCCAQGASV